MKKVFFAVSLLGFAAFAQAQMTPLGAWHTIDDETKKPKAVIRISANANGLSGVVEKSLDAKPNAEVNCDKCTDDRKGKPKIGMEIIRGVKPDASGENLWANGGKILDPENGKEYTVKMVPQEGGKKLQVRGYIGPFYRTQVWLRAQ